MNRVAMADLSELASTSSKQPPRSVKEIHDQLVTRFQAYSVEVNSLRLRLDNPRVPEDKKVNKRLRLKELEGTLMPRIVAISEVRGALQSQN